MNLPAETKDPPGATVIIEPFSASRFPDLVELFRHRSLLWFLVRKDVSVRYKQTLLGVAWVVLRPLSMMALLTFVFGHVLERDVSDGMPFAIFVFSALVAWTYFSSVVSECVHTVSSQRELVGRVYFPRLILPLVPTITHLADFVVSLAVLAVLLAVYGEAPGLALVGLPAFFLLLIVFAVGSGVWLAALNVRYRDVPYAIPFLLQAGFFASPIIYSVQELDTGWGGVYHLNPMVGIVEGFRWTLAGGAAPSAQSVIFSAAVSGLVFLLGLWYFGSREGNFVRDA